MTHPEETNGSNLRVDQTKSKTLESTEAADDADGQLQAGEPISSLPCLQEDQSSEDNNGAEVVNTSESNMVQNDHGKHQSCIFFFSLHNEVINSTDEICR